MNRFKLPYSIEDFTRALGPHEVSDSPVIVSEFPTIQIHKSQLSLSVQELLEDSGTFDTLCILSQ